ncbi:MAG: hypothetical protein PUD63_11640 [Clostridia bacterium]|nr:hypothetical protein [Clostridia bacterium]
MKVAAIGIGSNSLRMLVADIEEGRIQHSIRYREGLRVFAALDENRNISAQMIQNACEHVLNFKLQALAQGAQKVHLFATSAVRDAANQEAFIQALETKTGLTLDVCSGEEEALLSFLGASENRPTGLIDIGGGSTEIARGCGRTVDDAVSLQMGAVRLYRMRPIASIEDAEAVVTLASTILEPVRQRFITRSNEIEWVGVGGTFTTSAALVQRIPWQQREKIHHFSMTQSNVREIMHFLAPMSLEDRLQLDCLQPQRADIVVHGIAILLACMSGLNIPSIKVSEHGNLEGYLKEKYVF